MFFRFRRLSPLFVLFLILIQRVYSDDYSQWSRSIIITLDTRSSGANVSGNVINFPVLVRLDSGNFKGFADTKDGGADIRFSKHDGTHLPYEIERWVDGSDNNDTTEIWVLVDTVWGDSQTTIKMYYGNSTASDSSNSSAVFSTSNGFAGVWHLEENGDNVGKDYLDATSNNNDGIGGKGVANNVPVRTQGMIGNAQYFADTGTGAGYKKIHIDKATSLQLTGNFTLNFWMKPSSDNYPVVLANQEISDNRGYYWRVNQKSMGSEMMIAHDSADRSWSDSDSSFAWDTWYHVVAFYDTANNNVQQWFNGVLKKSSTIRTRIPPSDSGTTIGHSGLSNSNAGFNGIIDEIRISNVVRDSNWIKLCYENQKPDESLVAVDTTQVTIMPTVKIEPLDTTVVNGSGLTLSATVTGSGPITYVWQKDGVIVGTNSSKLELSNVTSNDSTAQYRCIVSNSYGADTSSTARVHVDVIPSITTQPKDVAVIEGDVATFVVTATGFPKPTYQWKKNNISIPSATDSVYKLENVTLNDSGAKFSVEVSNRVKSILSNEVILSVLPKENKDIHNLVKVEADYVDLEHVKLNLSNYSYIDTNVLGDPYADSIGVWRKSGSFPTGPDSWESAQYRFSLKDMKNDGETYSKTVSVPSLSSNSDSVYYFLASIHWKKPDSLSKFSNTINGDSVVMKDTSRADNLLKLSAEQLGHDSVRVLIDSLSSIDKENVSDVVILYGLLSDFTDAETLTVSTDVLSSGGSFTKIIVSDKFITGNSIDAHFAVYEISKNGNWSKGVFYTLPIKPIDVPNNPVRLSAHAENQTDIVLSWDVVAGDSMCIIYSTSPVPNETELDNHSSKYLGVIYLNPDKKDTVLTGFSGNTTYYFGLRIHDVIWSYVTNSSSAFVKTDETNGHKVPNNIIITDSTFDESTNKIRISWKITDKTGLDDSRLFIAPVYSLDDFSSKKPYKGEEVKGDSGTIEIDLGKKLVFNATYYVSLWLKDVAGDWSIPNDKGKCKVKTPGFTFSPVSYFSGTDTMVSAFDGRVFIRKSPKYTGVVTDTLRPYVAKPSLISGCTPVGVSFRFDHAYQSAEVYVGIKYDSLPDDVKEEELRIYRDSSGTLLVEHNSILDKDNKIVWVLTRRLSKPFLLLADKKSPNISRISGTSDNAISSDDNLEISFSVNDNVKNVKWSFLYGNGNVGYINQSTGFVVDDEAITHIIPSDSISKDYGFMAKFIVNDGAHSDTINISKQVKIPVSDEIPIWKNEWVPLRVTSEISDTSFNAPISSITDISDSELKYDKSKFRVYRWYQYSENAENPSKWVEYSSDKKDIFSFVPGRVIWIKSINPEVIKFGEGLTTSLKHPCHINLPAKSWVDIANPFKFNVPLREVLNATNGGDSLQIYHWKKDGTIYKAEPVFVGGIKSLMESREVANFLYEPLNDAYTVYNPFDTAIVMEFPPISSYISKASVSIRSFNSSNWDISFVWNDKNSKGNVNRLYCGYSNKLNKSVYYPLAPSFGKLSVGVVNPDDNTIHGHVTVSDLDKDGIVYRFKFTNNYKESKQICYHVDYSSDFPNNFDISLFNPENGKYENISESNTIDLPAMSEGYRFVIVGDGNFKQKFGNNFVAYEPALTSIFPSPVNNKGVIKYMIPYSGAKSVKFHIYTITGKLVWSKTLNSNLTPGNKTLVWSGKSNLGAKVPSGTYLIRMQTIVPGRGIKVVDKIFAVVP